MSYKKPIQRLERFKNYCERKGINLLYDDLKFIDEQLIKIYPSDQKSILLNYVDIWLSHLGEAQNARLTMNLGRAEANKWLRDYINSINT